jgi:hypothetical protein
MKIIKSSKQLKGLVILTGIYALLAICICFSVIFFMNTSIKTHITSQDIVAKKGIKDKSDLNIISNLSLTDVPDDAENISFSYDDKYCTYLYNSVTKKCHQLFKKLGVYLPTTCKASIFTG